MPRGKLPMLPDDMEERKALVMKWTNQNIHAAAFLMEVAEIARLTDDLVDEDENRQRNAVWLWTRTLVHLPQNQFWQQNAIMLGPMLVSVIVQWQQSDEYRKTDDPRKQIFGFVMREAIEQIAVAVAGLCGGIEFAKAVADDIYLVCHANETETVEDWVKEDHEDGVLRESTEDARPKGNGSGANRH